MGYGVVTPPAPEREPFESIVELLRHTASTLQALKEEEDLENLRKGIEGADRDVTIAADLLADRIQLLQ